MVKDLLTPDYIFESSWEVCNKVGGIYTVLSTREETPEPTPEPTGPYIDGTYTGSSYGYSGRVNVTVTIQGGQIASIEQSNSDSPEYFDYAWETIYPQIMGNQSADGIDAASGATYSSEGILGAIQKALAQALA